MAAEKNKKLIERLFSEAMNGKNSDIFDEVLSPKFTWNGGANSKPGPAGFKEQLQPFFTAFPDMKVNAQQIVAEGDIVATRGYITGTHKGTFMGIPATNKQVRIDYIDWWQIENNKCVANWVQMDMPGVWQQLNAKPATGQTH